MNTLYPAPLATLLQTSPYQAYSYAYPHKTAYRPLAPPVALEQIWATERRDALFLYVHIPFCEMRCGFCNLFTQTQVQTDGVTAYLTTLQREAVQVKAALGTSQFARLAIGGGTPTFLTLHQLEAVFALITNLGADPARSLGSVEVSPGTVTGEKLRFLRGQGIDRISIGIQSFVEAETAAAGRPQKLTEVYQALEQIRAVDFPTLNLDLIYGLPGQTIASWLYSVDMALQFAPEELYLYPLYVRPLTGLGRSPKTWADDRRDFYRQARDRLLAQGYEQVSMRMFRAAQATVTPAPVYCCQSDGMVGIGCGARSYTRSLHYSSEYAVGRTGIQAILEQYQQRSDQSFSEANYGFWLTLEEQKRRFILQSILQMEGLTCARYQQTFGSEVGQDFPQLAELLALGLAHQTPTSLILTAEGIEQADTIGPWLYSAATHQLMESYAWR